MARGRPGEPLCSGWEQRPIHAICKAFKRPQGTQTPGTQTEAESSDSMRSRPLSASATATLSPANAWPMPVRMRRWVRDAVQPGSVTVINLSTIDLTTVIDVFLLLLIGIGPKIALVPFLELTAKMDDQVKDRVTRKMLRTATITALLLMVFGGLLTRLLHFSTGALAIAGGIVLLVISIAMILSRGEEQTQSPSLLANDPLRLAVFPLAVPYLLNPAGIVTLVTVSAEAGSLSIFVIVLGLLAVVIGLDVVIFRWAKQVSAHLDASRMLVTEKVFGFLLAALAIQLVLEGLADVGVIHLVGH